jgi:hypothetical protein
LSQDPEFWSGRQNLANPQSLNSYSYAYNNPVVLKDPSGRSLSDYVTTPNGGEIFYSLGATEGTYFGVPIYSNGQTLSGTPNGPYQCPDFTNRFVSSQYGANLNGLGNGSDYGNQSLYNTKMSGQRGSFAVYQNGGTTLPQENDIFTWTDSSGSYGHTGVVVQVDFNQSRGTGVLWTAEQNQSARAGLFQQPITSKNINGVTTYTVQPKPNGTLNPSSFARYQQPQSSQTSAQVSRLSAILGVLSSIVSAIAKYF